jgi:hypothetical protein
MRLLRYCAIVGIAACIAFPSVPVNAQTAPARKDHPVTMVIGDSITYRSRQELSAIRPKFVIQGVPGSNANSLKSRVQAYLADHRAPNRLVIELGSNGFHTDEQDYTRAIDLLPSRTVVGFVTAWRNPAIWGKKRSLIVWHNTESMLDIARHRPRSCTIGWRPLVVHDPRLLVDGLHPTVPHGEKVFARTVADGIKACI